MIVPSRTSHKRPAPFMPALEALEERLVPTSPHFVSASDSLISPEILQAKFKEAGLGSAVTVNYTLTATINAQAVYVNNGNNLPQGQPFKLPPFTLTSLPAPFQSTKAGNITGSVQLDVTSEINSLLQSVPQKNGMTVELASISYTDVTLTDTTNGISAPLANQMVTLIQPKHG
jgi:hypothetical protein